MTDETAAPTSEKTMLYREPTGDSDQQSLQDIWGRELETRVVNASEVPNLLADGWVQHPLDLGKKPEERAGFSRVASGELQLTRDELDAAQNLADELTAENGKLKAEIDETKQFLEAEVDLRKNAEARVAELGAEIAALKANSRPQGGGKR